MVALTKDTIRILAAFQSADAPVVSLYLDVDGRHRPRPQEYERQLDRMVRDAMSSFDGGRPAGEPLDVLSGFLEADEAHGRPVGVAIDKRGALLVADDVGNTIWRVSAATR